MTVEPLHEAQVPTSGSQAESVLYAELGVSSAKADVHRAIANVPPGLFPSAFCRILPDIFAGSSEHCVVSHADGAGTKSLLAYVHYLLHGDANVFKGIAQDAVVMNLDDMICVGAVDNFALSSIINRNAKRIGSNIVQALIEGAHEFVESIRPFGVNIELAGGETADVGDVVRTIMVDSVMTARMPRSKVIQNDVAPGSVIIGLPSGGEPAVYETSWNSGIGSNGLTLARHTLLSLPPTPGGSELFDDAIDARLAYSGPYAPEDPLAGSPMSVIDALVSPTRTFAPIVRAILDSHAPRISGLIHCSGGGQLKCLRFGRGIVYRKSLGHISSPLFRAIHESGPLSWQELAKVLNLGYRFEIICTEDAAHDIMSIAQSFGVEPEVLGTTEAISGPNQLELQIEDEICTYQHGDDTHAE